MGNTLGATTFTSFGAYWITFALISTFENPDATKDTTNTTCQNETLMGLFMLVRSLIRRAIMLWRSSLIITNRPGSYSQLSCFYVR